MKDRFDLEQEIMDCWKVTDEINMVTKHFIDSPQWKGMSSELADAMMNKYFAIAELYELKFLNLFDTFGECIAELSPEPQVPTESKEPYKVRLNDVSPAEWDQVSKRFYQDRK